jgi:hypothetical protein
VNGVRLKVVELGDEGVVVQGRGAGAFTIRYSEILTAERLRSARGLDLHTRGLMEPIRVRCRRSRREELERGLRFMGVRIVDCWGAIIAPSLLDFEEELAREPVHLRQSSDDA